jgi:hypothetical protein
MTYRNMTSPLTGLDDARPVEPASADLESVELEPFREFEFDLTTNRLRVAGYSPAEAADLLALYRDHLMKLSESALAQMDAMNQANGGS